MLSSSQVIPEPSSESISEAEEDILDFDDDILSNLDGVGPRVSTRGNEQSENRSSGQFRLNAKNLFLTYPRCDAAPEDVMVNLKIFFGDLLVWAVVGTEPHADGFPHLHISLSLTRKVNYRDPFCLDCIVGQHGSYEGTRSKKGSIEYCTKNGDYEEFNFDCASYLEARKRHKSVQAIEVAKGVMEGTDLVSLNVKYPGFMLMNLPKVQTYQSWYGAMQLGTSLDGSDLPLVSPLGLTPGEVKIRQWLLMNLIGKPSRRFGAKQLYLWGPTNLGKTSLLMMIETKYRVFWCPMDEDYYDGFDDKLFDVIVMDEYKAQKKIQFMNGFVGGQPVKLRVKGGQVTKRKNLPVIITGNYSLAQCYHKVAAHSPAILGTLERRFEIVELQRNIHTLLDRFEGS